MMTGGRAIAWDDASSIIAFCFCVSMAFKRGVCVVGHMFLNLTSKTVAITSLALPYPPLPPSLSPFLHLPRNQKGTMHVKCVHTPPSVLSPPQPPRPIPHLRLPNTKPVQT